MLYTEEYTELLNTPDSDNINIGNTTNAIGPASIQISQLSKEVTDALSGFSAQYKLISDSMFIHDSSYHTLDLSDDIGSGVKTLLFSMLVISDDDGDFFRFANPDNHNLYCELLCDINPSPTNYTNISGVVIATTNDKGQIDYQSNNDNTQVTGRLLGYWKTTLL